MLVTVGLPCRGARASSHARLRPYPAARLGAAAPVLPIPGEPGSSRSATRSWSLRSSRGDYQFQSPSRPIRAGTSRVRTTNASISTAATAPTPISFRNTTLRGGECADRDRQQHRGGGDDPARPLQPEGDRLAAVQPPVVGLLDAGEQEHPVVGGEGERDRRQHQVVALLDPSLGGVRERALEPAVLKDQDEQPGGGADRQQRSSRAPSPAAPTEPVISHSTSSVPTDEDREGRAAASPRSRRAGR